MAMRSVAKFTVNLGLFGFPVACYKADDEPTKGIGFNQIHSKCGSQINRPTVCRHCNEDVATADILKATDFNGVKVQVTDAELKALKPEAEGTCTLTGYMPADELDPSYIEGAVFFLAPDRGDKGKGDQTTYATFRDALKGRYAIGSVVMYGREHIVAIRAVGKVLSMHYVRSHAEVRASNDLPRFDEIPAQATGEYVEMMSQVIDKQMIGFADVAIDRDSYVAAVEALLTAKAAGAEAPAAPESKPAAAVVDLKAMLLASLAAKAA